MELAREMRTEVYPATLPVYEKLSSANCEFWLFKSCPNLSPKSDVSSEKTTYSHASKVHSSLPFAVVPIRHEQGRHCSLGISGAIGAMWSSFMLPLS